MSGSRRSLVRHPRQETVREPVHQRTRQNELTVPPQPAARRARQVIGAEHEVGSGERARRDAVPVAKTQQRDDRKLGTRGVTADRQPSVTVLEQPERGRLAVVRGRRVRMLGRKPVVDADDRQSGCRRELGEVRILQIGAADRPAAAVEVQVRATRLRRFEHTERDLTSRPGNRDRSCVLEIDRRRKCATAVASCLPGHFRR